MSDLDGLDKKAGASGAGADTDAEVESAAS